jgi:hypothetical protein
MLSHEDHDMMRPLRVLPAAQVLGRHVFYNNSRFDGRDPAANSADDGAVATDKQALLPGQSATFANVTGYTRGINGVMVDVRDLTPTVTPNAADFAVKSGAGGDPALWADVPIAPTVSVRRGAGVEGSDRVTLTWPDGVIRNTWLRVALLPTAKVGVAAADVFYFGNLVGESGHGAPLAVSPADLAGTRSRLFSLNVPATDRYDHDRNGRVDAADVRAVRANLGRWLPVLAPPPPVSTLGAASVGPVTAAVLGTVHDAPIAQAGSRKGDTKQQGACSPRDLRRNRRFGASVSSVLGAGTGLWGRLWRHVARRDRAGHADAPAVPCPPPSSAAVCACESHGGHSSR